MADFYTYSGNVYDSAAAGTTTFALTSSAGNAIPYLQRSHIHVYLSDDDGGTWTEQARPAAWDFDQAATSIVLVTGITAGQWVRVLRITPVDVRYVDFADGTLLTAGQLDQGEDYSRFCDQEQRDQLAIAVNGAVIYKGNVDLTVDNAPPNPVVGWSYFNTGSGNVIQGGNPGWVGMVGDAITGGERIIYDGAQWDLIQTPAGQIGVISISGTAPITIDNTDPQRPVIGSNALTDITVTAPLTVDKTNPAEPALDITNATTSADGAMSSADKTKLDGLPDNATLDATYLKKAGDTYTGYLDSSATSAFRFPQGTTGERPGTPNQGDVRFNTTTTEYEAYDGTNWGPLGGGLMHVSTTAPANFKEGNQWYDENTGRSYVYIDGTTQAWVDQNPGGGGGTTKGGGQNLVFQENEMTCTADYQLTAGRSALSAGPITINNGVTISIPNNQNWVIL